MLASTDVKHRLGGCAGIHDDMELSHRVPSQIFPLPALELQTIFPLNLIRSRSFFSKNLYYATIFIAENSVLQRDYNRSGTALDRGVQSGDTSRQRV